MKMKKKGGEDMYIDYSKLWKLLIDKGMSKTDLLELTGISSRVLAKLSKNETVTTDTIARICAALRCDVGDIMECVSEERLSIYGHYKKYGKCIDKNELYKTVVFDVKGQKYRVCVSLQSANKATRIFCRDNGTVVWEQQYAVGISPTVDRKLLIKPTREPDETVIVLIKGKPALIGGLDEGRFRSSRGYLLNDSDVYVMSEAAFKLFEPKDALEEKR